MGISDSLEVSASGLTAERLRMDVIANNLANINTTRTANSNTPYRRKHVVFEAEGAGPTSFSGALGEALGRRTRRTKGGVRVAEIAEDRGEFKKVYDPGHPDADPKTGYVMMPNVEPVMEMVDLMSATRAYEAGISVITSAKQMEMHALEIGKG
jgi:flagellar basal-body rod protein FlgC